MASDENALQPEREQTDESLRVERERTDVELAARLRVIEAEAAGAIDRARDKADGVRDEAREEVDHNLAISAPWAATCDAIVQARALEDEALEQERAAADERLRRQRDEHLRMLLRILPLEREKTDQYLLTERARSDEAISNRDDFLSIVSHDLRNLLSTVSMSAQMIEREVSEQGDESGASRAAKRIQRVTARMNRLIGDLVDVSSIESGKLRITLTRSDAAALITEALDAFRPATSAKGISLESEHVEGPLLARFDHDRILQVLANLIGNAIKFSSPGGVIRLACAREGDDVRFSVRDTGPGIPEAQLEAVFERFWQVGENDRRGLGLGLYISRSIIEAHGGKLWAESTLGVSSVFHFTLAAASAVSERTSATPAVVTVAPL